MYRDILYVLDRGHGLQAPCGESGSNCGFSAGFAGLQLNDSRSRSRGNVGIPAGISKGCGKGGKPALWLSMLSIPRHFHGLFLTRSSFDRPIAPISRCCGILAHRYCDSKRALRHNTAPTLGGAGDCIAQRGLSQVGNQKCLAWTQVRLAAPLRIDPGLRAKD